MGTLRQWVWLGAGVTFFSLAAGVIAAGNSSTKNTVHEEYVFKADETVFTGTVVVNDVSNKTLTVEGHHPLRRETVMRNATAGQSSARHAKAPAVTDAQIVFHADSFCRVALTNGATGRLSDVQPGMDVDVLFRKAADSNLIVTAIQAAAKHPYDQAAVKAPRKKH